MQNQERLWKAEEEAAAEQRSLAELRKKIEDERGREELRQAAIAGGHQKCVIAGRRSSNSAAVNPTVLALPFYSNGAGCEGDFGNAGPSWCRMLSQGRRQAGLDVSGRHDGQSRSRQAQ
jgi:N-terminal domain of CBF1 interacting co-repressor CIR